LTILAKKPKISRPKTYSKEILKEESQNFKELNFKKS